MRKPGGWTIDKIKTIWTFGRWKTIQFILETTKFVSKQKEKKAFAVPKKKDYWVNGNAGLKPPVNCLRDFIFSIKKPHRC